MPDRIGEGAVSCHVPDRKPSPGPAWGLDQPGVLVIVKGRRRLQVDDLPVGVHTVTPHHFSHSQRKCRSYSCFHTDAAVTLRGHGGRREKDLARGYKTVPFLNRVQEAVVVI